MPGRPLPASGFFLGMDREPRAEAEGASGKSEAPSSVAFPPGPREPAEVALVRGLRAGAREGRPGAGRAAPPVTRGAAAGHRASGDHTCLAGRSWAAAARKAEPSLPHSRPAGPEPEGPACPRGPAFRETGS